MDSKMKNIYDFRDSMGLKVYTQTFKNDGLLAYRYAGVYATGDFSSCFDYDAGILWVSFSISPVFPVQKGKWSIGLSISTVDDGGLQASEVDTTYTLKDAAVRLEVVVEAFNAYMGRSTKLPTEEELNKFLMSQAMWGEYTG